MLYSCLAWYKVVYTDQDDGSLCTDNQIRSVGLIEHRFVTGRHTDRQTDTVPSLIPR